MKLFAAAITLALCATAHAQQYAVAEVRATGSQRFPQQDILRAANIEKSAREVPLTQVKEAAAKLLGLGVFKEVAYKHTAVPGGMKVEFTVKDADQFVRADFDNVVWLPLSELIDELHKRVPLFNGELPLQPGGSLADDVAAALQGLLNERGIKGTVGFAPAGPREGLTESYIYTVDDVEVKIGQFNFANTSPAFSPLLEAAVRPLLGTHFQRSSLKKFAETNLLGIYRRRGYLRAEFDAPQVAVAAHKDAETIIAITLPVREGRAYSFAGLRWSGNTVRSISDLDGHIHLRPGQPADGVQLDFDLTQIRTQYAQRGYMHMFIDLKPTYDDAASSVRYEAAITEGGLFSMGKLDIAGLQPSSEEKVRQRWRLREGDPFDADYVKKFFGEFRLPPGVAYVVEQSEGEAANSIDLTLIFCKEGTKCLASNPNQLYIPDDEERRRR